MSQPFRLNKEGLINRNKKISFTFNGKKLFGYEGDTIASALIANGIHLVGRSFKYHRPRGFFGAGVEEPNAKLQVEFNGHSEPNVNATEMELVEGLSATSQNCWPSVNFDIGAINNFLKMFFPAGFYYKTFMWPKSFWYKIYEPFIRKAAGLGVASIEKDKERYEHKFEYCDLLVTGSGPAGLASAYAAAKSGAKVIGLARDHSKFNPETKNYIKYKTDFSNEEILLNTIAKIIKDHKDLDCLVSNAGFGKFGTLETFSTKAVSYTHLTLPTKA